MAKRIALLGVLVILSFTLLANALMVLAASSA
jgi:hypothetical protein